MEEILEEFIAKEGTPNDEELEQLCDDWKDYISKTDIVRSLHCSKDFMMGMIIMAKRLTK